MADELAKLLGDRYVQRRDVKSWQQPNGSYLPDFERLTWGDLRGHIDGTPRRGSVLTKDGSPLLGKSKRPVIAHKTSMGHYLLDEDDLARVMVFDLDVVKSGEINGTTISPRDELASSESPHRPILIGQLRIIAEGLARRVHRELDIHVAVSFSGRKGMHVAGFTGPERGADVRGAAHDILKSVGVFTATRGDNFFRHENEESLVEIEVFPKSDDLAGKDVGNLCRVPLGIHAVTGAASTFLRFTDDITSIVPMDPIEALTGALPWG